MVSTEFGEAAIPNGPLPPLDPGWIAMLQHPEFAATPWLHDVARERKAAIFGGRVYPVVPLYVTSICGEHCAYCNYRAENKGIDVERVRLSDAELTREVDYLVDQKGFRAIELVYASDPQMPASVIARHIELVRKRVETVGLSAEALDTKDYKRLVDAGLTFSVVWQETYDRARYSELHPYPTRKSNFDYRLESYERMIDAGIEHIGMGVLSGLADWRYDWSMLLKHQRLLRPSIIGIPRLKPAAGAFSQDPRYRPSDVEFRALLAIQNAFLPHARPFISTRESFEFGVELAAGGGCLFTLNCSTIPGGYSLGHSGGQFATGSYDVQVYANKLRAAGLTPEFDWSFYTEERCRNRCSA